MFTRYTVAVAVLTLGIASIAQAQQSTSDTTRRDSIRVRDQRALSTDTTKLHLDRARLDSARTLLDNDRTLAKADEKRIDSLQTVLKSDHQKGDSAAVARDKAAILATRKKMDTAQDRAQREERRVEVAQKTVRRETGKTMETRQDIKQDKPGPKSTSKKKS